MASSQDVTQGRRDQTNKILQCQTSMLCARKKCRVFFTTDSRRLTMPAE